VVPVKLVGLTGGIGSGKSTAARMFADRGAVVIDADRLAREVVAPGSQGFQEVVGRFGQEVVGPDGALDRQRLAGIVFGDEEARRDLNAIVHPRVGERIAERLAELADHPGLVVLDVPLLVEVGTGRGYDAVVVVTAPEDVRVRRLAERGMDPDDVRARMAAQAGDEERLDVATHTIDNRGGRDDLAAEVDRVYEELTR
jgi:dephospho-CoA kinase